MLNIFDVIDQYDFYKDYLYNNQFVDKFEERINI